MSLSDDGNGHGRRSGETQEGAAGDGRRAVGGHQESSKSGKRGNHLVVVVAGAGKSGTARSASRQQGLDLTKIGWHHSTPLGAGLQAKMRRWLQARICADAETFPGNNCGMPKIREK